MDYIKFDAISGIEIVILVLAFLSIIFILFLEPMLSRKKLVNKNEHGSSKFADLKEINNIFTKENIRGSKTIGFPIWYEKRNDKFEKVYLDNKSPHYLLIGSTGSGKSVTVVIPECLMFATAKEKHSVVVTDPKGEISGGADRLHKGISDKRKTADPEQEWWAGGSKNIGELAA